MKVGRVQKCSQGGRGMKLNLPCLFLPLQSWLQLVVMKGHTELHSIVE